jgi:SAM-dependent methyltransferase
MQFDSIHPTHPRPQDMHQMRAQVAGLILEAGHRCVLDLPSGTGELTQMLRDQGLDVLAADLFPVPFVATGRSCLRVDLNGPLPFEDGRFDAVACIEGVEHIENPHLLAREANRILNSSGRFYISTPNALSIRSRLSYLLRAYPNYFHYMIETNPEDGAEWPIDHINPVGYLELRYVLNRWGFRVEEVRTNRYLKARSPFYQLLRLVMLTKGRKSSATSPAVAEVRRRLLSNEILFGEALIVIARKVADWSSSGVAS